MLSAKKGMVAGGIMAVGFMALVLAAPSSYAMTFSFSGSSSNNHAFSFVAPTVPQVMQYHFGNVIPQSFERLIPPVPQYIFGGASQPARTYGYNGSSYTYGGGSSNNGSSYTYGTGSTGNSGSGYTYGSGSGSTSGSGYSYGTGSSSGGSSSGSSYSYGTGLTSGSTGGSSSGSSYSYGTGSSSGSSSSGSSSSGSSFSGSTSPTDDNVDSPDDALAVAKTTFGASVVNLMLNGQMVQGNNLPSYLQGQNPFSYWLVKGKPGGAVAKLPSAKKTYAFNSSSNAFSLKTCNPYKKPFNWSIQINPGSIPQNLVLMSTPQVTGGQTCSAGATGSCKKPTQMCYYADSYTAPSTLALSSSAPSWTVNMASSYGFDNTQVIFSGTSCTSSDLHIDTSTLATTLPVGGLLTMVGPFGNALPVANQTVTTNVLRGFSDWNVPQYFGRPGTYSFQYNGVNGPVANDPRTYYVFSVNVNASGYAPGTGYGCFGSQCQTGFQMPLFTQAADPSYAPWNQAFVNFTMTRDLAVYECALHLVGQEKANFISRTNALVRQARMK